MDTKTNVRINTCLRLLAASTLITASGCAQQEMSDLNQYVSQVKARQPQPLDPIPEMKVVENYDFVPEGLRNPFIPFKAEVGAADMTIYNGIRPDATRPKEELEMFALDALRMAGTLEQDNTIWALVKDTDDKVHRVAAGNYLGQNDGKIISITEDKVELTEIMPDGPGTWREEQSALVLAE